MGDLLPEGSPNCHANITTEKVKDADRESGRFKEGPNTCG